jgi:hypothetical protein
LFFRARLRNTKAFTFIFKIMVLCFLILMRSLKPGAEQVIEHLASQGVPLALASSSRRKNAKLKERAWLHLHLLKNSLASKTVRGVGPVDSGSAAMKTRKAALCTLCKNVSFFYFSISSCC